jgi:hypothetical protein
MQSEKSIQIHQLGTLQSDGGSGTVVGIIAMRNNEMKAIGRTAQKHDHKSVIMIALGSEQGGGIHDLTVLERRAGEDESERKRNLLGCDFFRIRGLAA